MRTILTRISTVIAIVASLAVTRPSNVEAADVDWSWFPPHWTVTLSHDEVEAITSGAALAKYIEDPEIRGAVALVVVALKACDALGGNNGVKVIKPAVGPPFCLPR